MAKKSDNTVVIIVVAAIVLYVLFGANCTQLSLPAFSTGGGGGGGAPTPNNADNPSGLYSVTLSADDYSICPSTYDRLNIVTNIPNGECDIYFQRSSQDPESDTWLTLATVSLGENGQTSNQFMMGSSVDTYRYTAVCVDHNEVSYGVSPYMLVEVTDCTAPTLPDSVPCPSTLVMGMCQNCPTGYYWDTGFNLCVKST